MQFIDSLMLASKGKTHIFSMGQAGYIIKSKSGRTLGIDLYLSECVERVEGHDGYHRLMPEIVNPSELNLDILIATHFHRDHFDIDAIPELMANGKTMLYCSYDCKDDVERLGIDNQRVVFAQSGNKYEVDGFEIRFTKCDHGTGAPQALGVLISVDNHNILEVGDTSFHEEWKDEYLSAGPIDVLIAPINGAYGNLNEQEHILLTKVLHPELVIPCHFGMFASHGGRIDYWHSLIREQIPEQKYKIFRMGEGIRL